MKWAIVIEKSENGFGAYAPDAPGVGVVGDTSDEARELLAEALELYLEESTGDGPRPSPSASGEYIELPTLAQQDTELKKRVAQGSKRPAAFSARRWRTPLIRLCPRFPQGNGKMSPVPFQKAEEMGSRLDPRYGLESFQPPSSGSPPNSPELPSVLSSQGQHGVIVSFATVSGLGQANSR